MTGNQHFKALLDNSPESIVLIGKNHEVLAFNKTIEVILREYFNKDIQVGDFYYPDFVIDPLKTMYLEAFNKAIRGEAVVVQELTENNNVSFWFEYKMTPVYDEANSFAGVSLSAKNITNEKVAELRIKDISERLKAILDNTDESIILLDLKYKILLANNIAVQTLNSGTGISELVGSDFRDFIPDRSNLFYQYYPKALEGERSFVEIPQQDLNGELHWYQMKFNPVFNINGEQIGVSIFTRDVTNKKEVEISLKESESRFKKITNLAPVGILITNSKFDITYANLASKKIFGYDEQELYGLSITKIISSFSFDNSNRIKISGSDLEINSPILNQERLDAINKKNDKIDILLSSGDFYNEGSINYIFIVQDITDIKNKEELILQQNSKLRDIAWHQSHTVRAPLARLMGLVYLLQHEGEQPEQDERARMLKLLIDTALELDKTIFDIVNKSQPSS